MMYKKRQSLLLIKESRSFIFFSGDFFIIIIITNAFGWLLFKITPNKWFLLKKYTRIQTLELSSKYLIKLFNYTSFSLFKPYAHYLKVIGRGYKFTFKKNKLIMRIGLSHKLLFKAPKNVALFYLRRYNFFLYGRSYLKIKNLMFRFFFLKRKSLYKRKGIFSKGVYFKLKQNNKKKLY